MLTAPISPGDLIDKLTILELKAARISDPAKLIHIVREQEALAVVAEDLEHPALPGLRAELWAVNAALWDVEAALRGHEARAEFGPDFIELARQVYLYNDQRAALKRRINLAFGSELIEEKSYG